MNVLNVRINDSSFLDDIPALITRLEERVFNTYKDVLGTDAKSPWSWRVEVNAKLLAADMKILKQGVTAAIQGFIARKVELAKTSTLEWISVDGGNDLSFSTDEVTITIPRLTDSYYRRKQADGKSTSFLRYTGATYAALKATPVKTTQLKSSTKIDWSPRSKKFSFFDAGTVNQDARPVSLVFRVMVNQFLSAGFKKILAFKGKTVDELIRFIESL